MTDNSGILDGKSITYQYEDLGTVKLNFELGLLSFEWIEGPYKGASGQDHNYVAKKVGSEIFLNWFEEKDSSLITLLIDLEQSRVHSSGLISPKSEDEMVLFHEATIVSHNFN